MSSLQRILLAGALVVLIPVGLARPARAGCRYVLVAFQLLECKEVAASEIPEWERSVDQLPEVDSTPSEKLLQVRCGCEYTLSGSDPRCDFEHNEEQESLLREEEGSKTCQNGKRLCQPVCPPEWTH